MSLVYELCWQTICPTHWQLTSEPQWSSCSGNCTNVIEAISGCCSIAALGSAGPGKWLMSEEVSWEIEGLHQYVASLAAHDMPLQEPVHLASALGLPVMQGGSDSFVLSFGNLLDLHFFWNSLRSHLRGFVTTVPLNWGILYDLANLCFASDSEGGGSPQSAPPTLMLAASLPGGAPNTENPTSGTHSEPSSGAACTSVPATSFYFCRYH